MKNVRTNLALGALMWLTACGGGMSTPDGGPDSGPAPSTDGGTCTAPLTRCGASCVNTQTSDAHCGSCGNACGAGTTCSAGRCESVDTPPANDARANAITLSLGAGETFVSGTTENATNDGPSVPCSCTSGGNVWYRFTLSTAGVVYLDTSSSSFDTSLFVTDSSGVPVPGQPDSGFPDAGLCNDDAHCAGGDWTSGQSRLAGYFDPGTYFVAVGGCGSGDFFLNVQHVTASRVRFLYAPALTGSGTTDSTALLGDGVLTGTCGGDASGEDGRWFITCGGESQLFSLCPSELGSWTRGAEVGGADPVLYVLSAASGDEVACNDDGDAGETSDCRAADAEEVGFTAELGSRITGLELSRGLHVVVVDDRIGESGMSYALAYDIR